MDFELYANVIQSTGKVEKILHTAETPEEIRNALSKIEILMNDYSKDNRICCETANIISCLHSVEKYDSTRENLCKLLKEFQVKIANKIIDSAN